jgi:hypothetical protein
LLLILVFIRSLISFAGSSGGDAEEFSEVLLRQCVELEEEALKG